jgi:peptidoglycan/LPS O-acetylase OafA/YrhL
VVRRLHSLDGLRAFSIALVLVGHGLPLPIHARFGDLGNLGVRWFFVISGFLITTLLLNELRDTGGLSLRRFYLRRVLRIFPAFYALLLGLFVLERAGLIAPIDGRSWVHALTYTVNYQDVATRSWYVAHLWSLAVEEQFYLLWPFALVLLGVRRGLAVAALVLVAAPALRFVIAFGFPAQVAGINWHFETVCDSLATGCLLAGCRDWLWRRPAYARWLGSWALAVVLVGVFATNWLVTVRPRVGYLLGQSAMNVGIALCIDRCMRFHTGPVGRLLAWRPIATVGTLSYSIYLWQQLFFNQYADSWVTRFPVNLAATLLVAWTSYTLIERPFLKLKDWFAVTRQPSAQVESRQ